MQHKLFSLFQILAVSPTHWDPLYNSDNHGLSINRWLPWNLTLMELAHNILFVGMQKVVFFTFPFTFTKKTSRAVMQQ